MKMADDSYDYDVIIVGCGVGGHGAVDHQHPQSGGLGVGSLGLGGTVPDGGGGGTTSMSAHLHTGIPQVGIRFRDSVGALQCLSVALKLLCDRLSLDR